MAKKEITWSSKKIQVRDLKEWKHNPRRMTKKGIADLKKSIAKFGVAEPLTVNLDNMICGGHGRKKVLEMLKVKEVDCYIPDRLLNEEEFAELNIRLNKNIAGEFDFDILSTFDVEMLHDAGFEYVELGMDSDDVKKDEEEKPIKEIYGITINVKTMEEQIELHDKLVNMGYKYLKVLSD